MTEFAGRVAQFQPSTQESGYGEGKGTLQVWDFEVQHLNDAGDVDSTVSVHMVAQSFDGRIHNDEDVKIELPKDWNAGSTAQVDRIWSQSRKVWVKAASDKPSGLCGIVAIGIVLAIAIAVVVGFVFVGSQILSHIPVGSATVPNVAGFNNVHAAQVLDDAGFQNTDEFEHSQTVPFGQVIRTDPAAGTKAPRGSLVVVYISDGP